MKREDWLSLAQKLDWDFSYVDERLAFPEALSGRPWLGHDDWKDWEEPFKTSYGEYVKTQTQKEANVASVMAGIATQGAALPPEWLSAVKLHAATLPLAEFAAVIGNLRAARFGRDGAWRTMATFGALDECRHTQIPLAIMHKLTPTHPQFDWTRSFYHSNNWVAIAARHLFDELLLTSDPIEFAVGTNFVFETGFTNLQFMGLSASAHDVGDKTFEEMLKSIQTDEARHSQIGPAVLRVLVRHDRAYAQRLLDKWFWRSWLLFAIVTGFTMDYLTPLKARRMSFKEFMEEWILSHFSRSLSEFGLEKPWYWDFFLGQIENYHHMVYLGAYTYRASVWFDFVMPGPAERAWLKSKYPQSWDAFEPAWERVAARWRESDAGNDFAVHGTAIIGFCNMCQIVLAAGTPARNAACTLEHAGRKHIFCSEPCREIFKREPERYARHDDVVKRVLKGEAPGNLIAMLTEYFGLSYASWGKDAFGGRYPWIKRKKGVTP